jgi:hypothetical protein
MNSSGVTQNIGCPRSLAFDEIDEIRKKASAKIE